MRLQLEVRKKLILLGLTCFLSQAVIAQSKDIDSLEHLLPTMPSDTNRVKVLQALCMAYWYSNSDKSEKYGVSAADLSKKLNFPKGLANSYKSLSATYAIRGDNQKAMKMIDESEALYLSLHDEGELAKVYNNKGNIYFVQGLYQQSIEALLMALAINERLDRKNLMVYNLSNLGIKYMTMDNDSVAFAYINRALTLALAIEFPGNRKEPTLSALYQNRASIYIKIKQYDHAILDINRSMELAIKIGDSHKIALNYADLADIKYAQKDYDKSLEYIQKAIEYYKEMNNLVDRNTAEIIVAENWTRQGKTSDAIILAGKCLREAQNFTWLENVRRASLLLMQNYDATSRRDSAFKYQEIYVTAKDSLFNLEKNQAIASLQGKYELNKKDRENHILAAENASQRSMLILLSFVALLAVGIGYIFFRGRRRESRSRELLNNANAQIELQNVELTRAINDLKKTQAQLIQSEKMASLGMLTTGITREINTPIDFISETVQTLEKSFTEMRADEHDVASQEVYHDIFDVIQTVKTGVNRTNDIVSGLRTFGKPGNDTTPDVDLHHSIDTTLSLLKNKLSEINVNKAYGKLPFVTCQHGPISQVLLNIIENAIYTIEEKKVQGQIDIRTFTENGYAVVSIRDNGTGIPKEIQTQVFDPFFTTKDVGKGTGLGLSISYNILKDHNGSLDFITADGEGTTFFVRLPLIKNGLHHLSHN